MNNSRFNRGFRKFNVLGSLIIIGLVISCGKTEIASDLKHELNNPTNGDKGFMWHDLSSDELKKVVYPLYAMISGGESVAVMKAEHPAVQRLQYWLDVIHDQLSTKHPEKFEGVVKPQAQVLVTDSPNAFVMPVPVCYDILTIIDDEQELNSFNTVSAAAVTRTGEVGKPWSSDTCVKKGESLAFLKEYIKEFNDLKGTCKLSLTKSGSKNAVKVGRGCQLESGFEDVVAAKKLVLHPVAGIITVHSGLLTMMTEEEVISVLAHELGHYYKVHVDHPYTSTYDYFYTLKESNFNGKPKAEAALKTIGEAAQNAELPTYKYRQVPGQKFRTELFVPILGVGAIIAKNQDCDEGECNKACAKFAEFTKSNSFKKSLGDFPFGPLGENGLASYRSFEKQAEACFDGVEIGSEKSKQGKSIDAKLLSYAITFDRELAPLFSKTTLGHDVISTLKSSEKSLADAEVELSAPLVEAARRAVGYYTTEQEADEIALEWMSMIGIDPSAAITSEFKLGDFVEGLRKESWVRAHPTELDIATCKRLYANDWRNSAGQYVMVPVGDYQDPHHSTCFRAFNVSREIAVHKYKPNTSLRLPAAPGGNWTKIQADVEKIHERMSGDFRFSMLPRGLVSVIQPAADPGIDASAFLKRNYSACPFFGN